MMQAWLEFHLGMKQQVQATLDRLKKTSQPGPALAALPSAFAEEPVSPKINMDQLHQMIVIYPLRKAKTFISSQPKPSGNAGETAMANAMMNPFALGSMQLGLEWLYRERRNCTNAPQQSLPGLQVFGMAGNHVQQSTPSDLGQTWPPPIPAAQQSAEPNPEAAVHGKAQLALQDGRPEESCQVPAKPAVQMGGGTAPAAGKLANNGSMPKTPANAETEKPKAVSPAKTGQNAGLQAMATLSEALSRRDQEKTEKKRLRLKAVETGQ